MMYKCAYCGKEYDNIESRTECEMKCAQEVKEQKAKEKEKKLAKEKETRKSAIDKMRNAYIEMVSQYLDDYHECYTGKSESDDNDSEINNNDYLFKLLETLFDIL